LSHSSKDKFFVRELAERLEANGVTVWLDEAEIRIGDSLVDRIGGAIDSADFIAVVLSTNSVDSAWVQKELQLALQRELADPAIKVLPLLLEPVAIPPFLRDKLYADVSTPEKFTQNFPKLLTALGVSSPTPVQAAVRPARERETEAVAQLTEAERRLASFEDLRIVDLDTGKTHNPDKQKLLFNMYLRLSERPPAEWQEIFAAERRFPRHNMWRRAWIEGGYIVVHCVPDELEQYHLEDLKQDVLNANQKYREYLTRLAREEAREAMRFREQRGEIDRIKDRLSFD
jgi:hypothetical protein